MPDRAVTSFPDCRLGEFLVRRLQLLQADTSGFVSPSQRIGTERRPLTPFTLKVAILISPGDLSQGQQDCGTARDAPDDSSAAPKLAMRPASGSNSRSFSGRFDLLPGIEGGVAELDLAVGDAGVGGRLARTQYQYTLQDANLESASLLASLCRLLITVTSRRFGPAPAGTRSDPSGPLPRLTSRPAWRKPVIARARYGVASLADRSGRKRRTSLVCSPAASCPTAG
jgi:hypothetical protein